MTIMKKTTADRLEHYLRQIAVPRPNHSRALNRTAAWIKQTLSNRGITIASYPVRLYPLKHLLVGIALLVCALTFCAAASNRAFILALLVAIAIPVLLLLEFEWFMPTVSRLVSRPAENLVCSFPAAFAKREVILCAHYDSKTDLFDHRLQQKIQAWMFPVTLMGIFLSSLWLVSDRFALDSCNPVFQYGGWLFCVAFLQFWFVAALMLGGFIFVKPINQSPGTIDNAGSVAVLLELATRMHRRDWNPKTTTVTFLFTCGEEVALQGSDAYVRQRFLKNGRKNQIPCYLVNLEGAGQSGAIMAWRKNGGFLRFFNADSGLIQGINRAVKLVTGQPLQTREKTVDDSHCFLRVGIPAVSIGHAGLPVLETSGHHSNRDTPERFSTAQAISLLEVLQMFITDFSEVPSSAHNLVRS